MASTTSVTDRRSARILGVHWLQQALAYRDLAAGFGRQTAVPAPLSRDPDEEVRLVHFLRRDLRGDDGHATATAVRIVWTAEHLNVARRPPPSLEAAAKPSGRR
ncbi:hypothetical protein [Streptomyces sp. NBC_00986]|uniref:hypothetical protein n=1 Tax=Streptomyces sp. NBC_00986 TaxID=2903702 RepID=UPI003866C75B|nr:hypothetical protein OG504_01945 [Streptomyces sp. NBC_00986]